MKKILFCITGNMDLTIKIFTCAKNAELSLIAVYQLISKAPIVLWRGRAFVFYSTTNDNISRRFLSIVIFCYADIIINVDRILKAPTRGITSLAQFFSDQEKLKSDKKQKVFIVFCMSFFFVCRFRWYLFSWNSWLSHTRCQNYWIAIKFPFCPKICQTKQAWKRLETFFK